jgi:hypothetical protein
MNQFFTALGGTLNLNLDDFPADVISPIVEESSRSGNAWRPSWRWKPAAPSPQPRTADPFKKPRRLLGFIYLNGPTEMHEFGTASSPNENKMSDGGRGRGSLGMEVWKSSQCGLAAIRRSLHRLVRPLGAEPQCLASFSFGVITVPSIRTRIRREWSP